MIQKQIEKLISQNPNLSRSDFYSILNPKLDHLLFPNGAPRGTYYNFYTNRC